MDVVRDLLDEVVDDRNGRPMGRVDGIVIEQGEGPPRVAAILIGPSVLASRLHPALGRIVTALERRLGVDRGRPVQIAMKDVERIERKIHVRLTVGDTAAAAIEEWLRAWVVKLPGSE